MRCFIFILVSTLLLPLSATAADLPLKVSKAAPLAHLCPAGKNWCPTSQQCRPSNLECAASPAK
jgi:hypothetical protein